MKNILGHKSWTMDELIEILSRSGSYCMPTLPHYRYSRVQDNCRQLKKLGLIEKSGRTDVGVNYKPSELFRLWQKEHREGCTTKMPIKWVKEKKRAIVLYLFCLIRMKDTAA